MRKLAIYRNGELTGQLVEESPESYVFIYDEMYYHHSEKPAVSLTLKKNKREHRSNYLFPFFYNMLSEGANKKLQCRHLKIDEEDHFGLLMETAHNDVIGPITVKKMEDESK